MNRSLKIKLDAYAHVPTKGHSEDAGLDIKAAEAAVIPARGFTAIHTGVHVAIPVGCVGLLTSKSGLMLKGITSTGTIDAGYTGEIIAVLYNHTDNDFTVEEGQKITQLVIMPLFGYSSLNIDVCENEKLRDDDGFGSTGCF